MIPCSVHYNSTTADSDLAKASLFNKYFFWVFTTPLIHPDPPNNCDDPNMLSEFNISDAKVLDALLNLDTTKAMGSLFFKDVYQPLSHLFSLTFQCSYFPTEWNIHKVIPIFKSGDPTLAKNYRLISLLSNSS